MRIIPLFERFAMRWATLLLLTAVFSMSWPGFAWSGNCGCGQNASSSCQCGSAPTCCCGHRGCRRCCCCPESREPRETRSRPTPRASIPSGPIVESYPVMRAVPTMVAMPMMPMMYGSVPAARAFEEDRPREKTCRESSDRLDQLETRVGALDLRMQTIQRAVELQTQILEELRAQGTIGGRRVPAESTAP